MADPVKKEHEKLDNDEDLKNLFKEFLMDWKKGKTVKEKAPQTVPVPPETPDTKEEPKEEPKKPGLLDWLF